ncbi:UbiA prenyltransferase family protein [Patescibacteria group bacterium]|nr:UbiA prenyltransferase family protein [Patescibacteria group bacterium]
MVKLLVNIFRSIRPKQSLKNLSLFAPLIFSGNLLLSKPFSTTFFCLIIFTILTSSIYIFNDLIDISKDKLHPYKKLRPITSGEVPIPLAIAFFAGGVFTSLYLAHLINYFFFLACLAYLILQIAYSFYLKNIVLLDILSIASGFIIRVFAGALAINVHMNVWFLLCVISLALFLAAGKRRSELGILLESAPKHRKTLSIYSKHLLDSYLSMFANSAWLAYALFTFFAPPPIIREKPDALLKLPLAFSGINKWLMITIPVVIFGIMRYLKIIYEGEKAESPEKALLSDKALLISVIIWAFLVVVILYGVG